MVERGQALALSLPRLLSSNWSSETILHLVDESFVSDLKCAWSKLEPIPKMRALMAFLGVSGRHQAKNASAGNSHGKWNWSMNEDSQALEELLDIADTDSDEWVSIISGLVRKWLIEQKVDEKGGLEEDEEGEAFKEGRSFKQTNTTVDFVLKRVETLLNKRISSITEARTTLRLEDNEEDGVKRDELVADEVKIKLAKELHAPYRAPHEALYLSKDQQPNALVFENFHFVPNRDPTESFSLDDMKDVVGSGLDDAARSEMSAHSHGRGGFNIVPGDVSTSSFMRSATPLEITGRRGGMSSGTKGSGGAWSGGHGIRCAKMRMLDVSEVAKIGKKPSLDEEKKKGPIESRHTTHGEQGEDVVAGKNRNTEGSFDAIQAATDRTKSGMPAASIIDGSAEEKEQMTLQGAPPCVSSTNPEGGHPSTAGQVATIPCGDVTDTSQNNAPPPADLSNLYKILSERSNVLKEEDRERINLFFAPNGVNPTPEMTQCKIKLNEETIINEAGEAFRESLYISLDYSDKRVTIAKNMQNWRLLKKKKVKKAK